jgi:LacI family transcriptional regulator
MATLRDIATEVGVSIRTVSRALSGSGYVRADLKSAIVEVADRLGYRPDPVAQSLRLGRTRQIVVVSFSVDELHMAKIAALEQRVRPAGFSVSVVMTSRDAMATTALVPEIRSRKPWGVVLIGTISMNATPMAASLYRIGVPCVVVDAVSDYPAVHIDRPAGVADATRYLIERGRRQIVYVGPGDSTSRIDGFRSALAAEGREPLLLDPGDSPLRSRIALRLLAEHPRVDAVQAYSDQWALELLAGLHERGVRVPDDIAVIGFDDRWAASYSWPALTTVAQPGAAIGDAIANLLIGAGRGRLEELCDLATSEPATDDGAARAHLRSLSGELTQRIPTQLVVRESA